MYRRVTITIEEVSAGTTYRKRAETVEYTASGNHRFRADEEYLSVQDAAQSIAPDPQSGLNPMPARRIR